MTWYLDGGVHLDQSEAAVIDVQVEFDADVTYRSNPFVDLELEIHVELDIDVVHAVPLDLLRLVPAKFRESEILQTYLQVAGIEFGDFLTKIRDIVLLLSPNTVTSTTYLRYLGALIGVTFPPEDETSEDEIRRILSQAIDWYKVKGTYESIQIIALAQSFTVDVLDMYTDDYSTFILTDWFVGGEGENPPGLGSEYYKSPHFGVQIHLDQKKVYGSQNYLWAGAYLDNFSQQVEDTRPVHTVPHYIILLNPKTDEHKNVITVSGEIKTRITNAWQFSTKYFDAVGSGQAWLFDTGGVIFDSSLESYIKNITMWVLGTGNYPSQIDVSTGPVIENSVLTGTIDLDDIRIDAEKYQFEFIVPKSTVQSGLSELGLYIPSAPTSPVLVATFPKIDLDGRVESRVCVQVYKEDLS